MIYPASPLAIAIFCLFVGAVLALSFYLGARAKSARGYYAAHGQVGWFVNGIAFAGDYLSAASFLGICGMIAFYGYDGFLYSIGYLAGWIVALFVIAEPIKRLGKFTFADALDAQFHSRGIKLTAAISTLIVSVFYLIPQMVGAGALIKPLLGVRDMHVAGLLIPSHAVGVALVGAAVIVIVVTAGMVSTTWVQFIKGSLLVFFCTVLVVMILNRGLKVAPPSAPQAIVKADGQTLINGQPQSESNDLHPVGRVLALPNGKTETGPLGPVAFLRTIQNSTIETYKKVTGGNTTTFQPIASKGADLLTPGGYFKDIKAGNWKGRLNFLSLMLALFCGTAALPHILIRYYTVKDAASARKSTLVGIAAIGFFYVLTLYLGLGAMTSGSLDPTDSNMSAPLLARSFNPVLFAIISAIAFTTVLGTVSGLIIAASGAVAHDLMSNFLRIEMDDHAKVRAGKIACVVIGLVAIVLGIVFRDFNVTFLVGWAFNIAASANLPALVMLLFWRGTTKQGITAAITVGVLASLAWILLSGDAYANLYGKPATAAPMPFNQPGIVTIPLGFVVLVVVSLVTGDTGRRRGAETVAALGAA
ncbi:MAG TPA: cation acetate symporter [Tepidisphaeraceae bacterium]|jgi:cation/acetate symporter